MVARKFIIEFEREDANRVIADVPALPGVMAYGATEAEADRNVRVLALKVLAERLAHGDAGADEVELVNGLFVTEAPTKRALIDLGLALKGAGVPGYEVDTGDE